MSCVKPLLAYRNDANEIKFARSESDRFQRGAMRLPCGQCIGCRLKHSRMWALRCMHEASLYLDNCFLTLTYDPKFLPEDMSLDKSHFQLFMKRLRAKVGSPSYKKRHGDVGKIRYYHCGEYGDENHRPHYHALIFNYDFPDKKLVAEKDGNRLYESPLLQELWPKGYATLGDVTFKSAAYVARYCTKKVTGEAASEHYLYVDDYGQVHRRQPEYATMSRRPGIGKPWLEKYHKDVYPNDFVVMNGKELPVPRYYDKLLEIDNEGLWLDVREGRYRDFDPDDPELSPERLLAKEKCALARLNQFSREV